MGPISNNKKSNRQKVQRKSTRFVKQDYLKYKSVTGIKHEIGWKNLQDRRKDIQLTMNYTIINVIANVPDKKILISTYASIRSKHGYQFCTMTQNRNKNKYSFFPQTIYKWKCLPK